MIKLNIASTTVRILACALFAVLADPASATSCRLRASLDESSQYFKIKDLQEDLAGDLTQMPLVAQARIEMLDTNNIYDDAVFPSARIARLKIQKFYRKPLLDTDGSFDPGKEFYVTLSKESFSVGDRILFFAYPEDLKRLERRINPEPGMIPNTYDLPSAPKQRLWFTVGSCNSTAYKIDSAPAKLLLREMAKIAKQANQPGTLVLKVFQQGQLAQIKPSGNLTVEIKSLSSNAKSYAIEVDVAKGGKIQLPPGRYHVQWPALSGLSQQCHTGFVANECFVQIYGGLTTYTQVHFTGNAKIDLMFVDADNKPIDFFAELALVPLKMSTDYSSGPISIAPLSTKHADTPDYDFVWNADEGGDWWLQQGAYQLQLSLRHFDASKKYSCEAITEKKTIIPIKLSGSRSEWSSELLIPSGKSLLLARIPPELALAKFEMTGLANSDATIEIKPHCSDFYNVRWSKQIKQKAEVILPIGMQVSMSGTCYQCAGYRFTPMELEILQDLPFFISDKIQQLPVK